ncbi:MAG: twin-arginine translocase TatA/TatE family subunit [Endozoicomonadaceae bacterium]|nr:twin-arginine translocase TatA/TatE family subunit [Endozoicomonadaceae bacterium]MBE8232520.1 twin-arginine translocase TatA/TatE family subunit [Endozoicomonadaceae bacterium]
MMFGVGFFEVLLILVIGMLVLSPDRFPELIKWIMITMHRIKRFWRNICAEVESTVDIVDVKQTLYNDDVMNHLKKEENQQSSSIKQAKISDPSSESK